MTAEEIRLRRLAGQYLTAPADKMTVVRGLCGVQAQYMSHALHALRIRCTDFDPDTAGEGLVKNWSLRGTMHVFAEDELPLFFALRQKDDYRSVDWSGETFWNRRDAWALTPERQRFFSERILGACEAGPRTREELKAVCRAAGMTDAEEDSMFDPWGGGMRELCERGFLHGAVQEEKRYCLSPPFAPVPPYEAELALARRYFENYAPATVHDAMYFFHVPAARVKRWLGKLPAQTAECGGKTYFYIETGRKFDENMPECLFLAGFDQLMLGYEKKESLFLAQERLREIFTLSGIVMPAVLVNGQAAGRWKMKNGRLSVSLFAPPGKRKKAAIRETAERLWNDLSAVEFV